MHQSMPKITNLLTIIIKIWDRCMNCINYPMRYSAAILLPKSLTQLPSQRPPPPAGDIFPGQFQYCRTFLLRCKFHREGSAAGGHAGGYGIQFRKFKERLPCRSGIGRDRNPMQTLAKFKPQDQDVPQVEINPGKEKFEVQPKNAYEWNELGNIYLKIGSNDKAVEAFNKAIKLDPYFGWAYSNLALAYNHSKKFQGIHPAVQKKHRAAGHRQRQSNLVQPAWRCLPPHE